MKSSEVEANSFTILSDEGQMIGGATIFDRERVVVNMISAFDDGDDPWAEYMPRIREWAEAEAHRLGLLDS